MTRGLAFLPGAHPADYGSRLARLRWRRACVVDRLAEWAGAAPARETLGDAQSWIVVRDARALPVLSARVWDLPPGRVVVSAAAVPADPPFVHTLRELEAAELTESSAEGIEGPAAFAFRAADFPPRDRETVDRFVRRLLDDPAREHREAFRVVTFADSSGRERPELTRRLPGGKVRILDVGCGLGAAVASARGSNPAWHVTGIERDPILAAGARGLCDRVLEGDLTRILPELEGAGERFEAIVYADVLEHLEDPVAALAAGRRIAAPDALVLVSVPNVGHVSLVRDLLLGRFDPTPSGLADAHHLRWFTRSFLADVLAEAGWGAVSISVDRGAPAPEADAFVALAAAWPDANRESLLTYQWIAQGRATPRI